jgi:hypothetical protein
MARIAFRLTDLARGSFGLPFFVFFFFFFHNAVVVGKGVLRTLRWGTSFMNEVMKK